AAAGSAVDGGAAAVAGHLALGRVVPAEVLAAAVADLASLADLARRVEAPVAAAGARPALDDGTPGVDAAEADEVVAARGAEVHGALREELPQLDVGELRVAGPDQRRDAGHDRGGHA